MKIHEQWKNLTEVPLNQEQKKAFWKEYLDTEKLFYKQLLKKDSLELKGSIENLSKEYEKDLVIFGGILDGINTSLDKELELDEIEDTTIIDVTIDKHKLYYNMLDSKAKWLFNLKEWDKHLTVEERMEIKKKYKADNIIVKEVKIGRNEPCTCGSGKKYKKCCLNK